MGSISGTKHMKTKFSFSPGVEHFIGNAFCSSGDFITQLIHILHFSTALYFTNPQKKKNTEELSQDKEEVREWVIRGCIQKFPD
jgi:hypothetical protein